jgi:hypothetical protein
MRLVQDPSFGGLTIITLSICDHLRDSEKAILCYNADILR